MLKYFSAAGIAATLLAGERWDIEKTRRSLNVSIEMEYEKSLSKIMETQSLSNLKGVEVYKKIYNRVRLGYPPLPSPYKQAVLRYCHRLLSRGTDKYRTLKDGEEPITMVETELTVWLEKSKGTQLVILYSFVLIDFYSLQHFILSGKVSSRVRHTLQTSLPCGRSPRRQNSPHAGWLNRNSRASYGEEREPTEMEDAHKLKE